MTVHFSSNAHHMPARSLLLICLALPVRAGGHPLLSDDRLVFSLQTIERHGHKYHFSAEGSNSDPLYTYTDNRMWNDNTTAHIFIAVDYPYITIINNDLKYLAVPQNSSEKSYKSLQINSF